MLDLLLILTSSGKKEQTSGTLEAWVLVALDILKVVVVELFVLEK